MINKRTQRSAEFATRIRCMWQSLTGLGMGAPFLFQNMKLQTINAEI